MLTVWQAPNIIRHACGNARGRAALKVGAGSKPAPTEMNNRERIHRNRAPSPDIFSCERRTARVDSLRIKDGGRALSRPTTDVVGLGLNATDTVVTVERFPPLGGKERAVSVTRAGRWRRRS